MNGGDVPFNTQFFHEDDFGPGFDDDPGFDGEGVGLPHDDSGEQDLLAITQGQTRRVRPEFVNYAKRAKRVDVRRLKENIWKGLDIVVPRKKVEDGDESMVRHPPFTFGIAFLYQNIFLIVLVLFSRTWTTLKFLFQLILKMPDNSVK